MSAGDNLTELLVDYARIFFDRYVDGIPKGVHEELNEVLRTGDIAKINNFFSDHLTKLRDEELSWVENWGMNPGEVVYWTQDVICKDLQMFDDSKAKPSWRYVVTNQRVIEVFLDTVSGKQVAQNALNIRKLRMRVYEDKNYEGPAFAGVFTERAIAEGLVPSNANTPAEDDVTGTLTFVFHDSVLVCKPNLEPFGGYMPANVLPCRVCGHGFGFSGVVNPKLLARMIKALAAPPKPSWK